MDENNRLENVETSGGASAKKGRKFHIIAFILCLLVAFVVWLYAVNADKKDAEEEQSSSAVANDAETVEAAELLLPADPTLRG